MNGKKNMKNDCFLVWLHSTDNFYFIKMTILIFHLTKLDYYVIGHGILIIIMN